METPCLAMQPSDLVGSQIVPHCRAHQPPPMAPVGAIALERDNGEVNMLVNGWSRTIAVAMMLGALALCASCTESGLDVDAAAFSVGVAKRDITPTEATAPPDGRVYLGGYGVGPVRLSTGVLAPIYVRAFVVSNGTDVVAFAQNETQGTFAGYKSGPYGLSETAAAVEAATGGRIPRSHVIIGSDHSHAGPDTSGVWGGLPDTYLQYLQDQTVGAITDALASLQPAELSVGTTDATDLAASQFHEPPNDVIDGELRVLLATEPGGGPPIGLLINYAAHATVMGSGNRQISADWPGPVATQAEQRLGIDTAVVMMGACGRTQPDRGDFGNSDSERLANYAAAVTERVAAALANVVPVRGSEIASTQLFLREPFNNRFVSADLLRALVSRSDRPPWVEGDTVGTVVSAARIGNLHFSAMPGEGYPAIQFGMEEAVPAAEHFIFGVANDQLGYLIAPESGYEQIAAAAPDNDNAIFNVSPAIGDHVMCTLLKAARAIGWPLDSDPQLCARWASEDNDLPP